MPLALMASRATMIVTPIIDDSAVWSRLLFRVVHRMCAFSE